MRKLTISPRPSAALILILTFYSVIFSQTETNSVPARWEYYSGKDKKVSFLLPRRPVSVPGGDHCQGEKTEIYAAYNDGVVFRVDITSAIEPPKFCFQKKDFDEFNFKKRVYALKAELKDEKNSENNISPDSVIKLTGNNRIIKLINDYKNKRWFEFAIYGSDEKKTEVINFLASLKTDTQTAGIDIGPGAPQTFGDEVSAANSEIKLLRNIVDVDGQKSEENVTDISIKIKDAEARNIVVALKPRANYTDDARRNRIQGKVLLRVTFMANGAIGAITTVRGLEHGLTEEAIKAARKLVFVPPQKDGLRQTVTKPVEYSFSIF